MFVHDSQFHHAPINGSLLPLFRLFVHSVLPAVFAVLLHLQPTLQGLLVFPGVIINIVALRTLEFNEIVLGHTCNKNGKSGEDGALSLSALLTLRLLILEPGRGFEPPTIRLQSECSTN